MFYHQVKASLLSCFSPGASLQTQFSCAFSPGKLSRGSPGEIIQGEKITLQNLAKAIESYVEADITLRGAFLVIDPKTDGVLKLRLDKVHKERLSHVGNDVYFAG